MCRVPRGENGDQVGRLLLECPDLYVIPSPVPQAVEPDHVLVAGVVEHGRLTAAVMNDLVVVDREGAAIVGNPHPWAFTEVVERLLVQ
jgi:hypothetical protein